MSQNKTPVEHRILEAIGRGIWRLFGGGRGRSGVGGGNGLDLDQNRQKWGEIEEMMKLGGPARYKQAVIEADKLLDVTLKEKGFSGEKMADRLRSAQKSMLKEAYNAAWQAHKIRNQIVHESSAEIMDYHAKEAVENYKKALNNLGGL